MTLSAPELWIRHITNRVPLATSSTTISHEIIQREWCLEQDHFGLRLLLKYICNILDTFYTGIEYINIHLTYNLSYTHTHTQT